MLHDFFSEILGFVTLYIFLTTGNSSVCLSFSFIIRFVSVCVLNFASLPSVFGLDSGANNKSITYM